MSDHMPHVRALMWSAAVAREASILRHGGNVFGCSVSPDGRFVASGSADKVVCITDVASRRLLHSVQTSSPVVAVGWSRGGTVLLCGTQRGELIQVTHLTGQWRTVVLYKSPGFLSGMACSDQGDVAVVSKTVVTILNQASKTVHLQMEQETPHRLAFSPDGTLLAVGCFSGSIYLFAHAADRHWSEASACKHHSKLITSLEFSPSGYQLLATSSDFTSTVWARSGGGWAASPQAVLKGHSRGVRGGVFVGEQLVATGADDATLRVWGVVNGGEIARVDLAEVPLSLSFHLATCLLAVGAMGGILGLLRFSLSPPPSPPLSPPFADDDVTEIETGLALSGISANQKAPFQLQDGRVVLLRRSIAKYEAAIADMQAKLKKAKEELKALEGA